jgi:hypothetical protein
MPDTQAYLNSVHSAIQSAENDMSKENITKMQKLLAYYPEMNVETTGVLDQSTKKGVQTFYNTYYENPNNSEKNIIAGEMKRMPSY